MKKFDERIRLRLKWYDARMATLLLTGMDSETASKTAYEEVRRLTPKELDDFARELLGEAETAQARKSRKAHPDYPHLNDVDKCPRCGKGEIRMDDPCEREPDMTERDCRCRACGFEWQDVFEKVPYVIGRQIDGELIQSPRQIIEQTARENAGALFTAASNALHAVLLAAHRGQIPPEQVNHPGIVELLGVVNRIRKGVVDHVPQSE